MYLISPTFHLQIENMAGDWLTDTCYKQYDTGLDLNGTTNYRPQVHSGSHSTSLTTMLPRPQHAAALVFSELHLGVEQHAAALDFDPDHVPLLLLKGA